MLATTVFAAGALAEDSAIPPDSVEVLPVFFVPTDQQAPSEALKSKLMQHVQWAQDRYRTMIGGSKTFALASSPLVFNAAKALSYYKAQPEGGAPTYVSEMLAYHQVNRYQCKYIYLVVLMNAVDGYPTSGGRPLNGGYNTGGGVIICSSRDLNQSPNFQSTLRHELGHSFGLPHVDVYGYNMATNASIMSYNPDHHTNGFMDSSTPGQLIAEDRRGLALNQHAFKGLLMNAPPGSSSIYRWPVPLGVMNIPGQPFKPQATTPSGSLFGSSPANAIQNHILPSVDDGTVLFTPDSMWHSDTCPTGIATIDITFPFAVTLDRLALYSQHSGRYHMASRLRILAKVGGNYLPLSDRPVSVAKFVQDFMATKAQEWRLEIGVGADKVVVVRGLRFYVGGKEIFPTLVPDDPLR